MTALHPKICRAIATARTGGMLSKARDLAREAQREIEAAAIELAAEELGNNWQSVAAEKLRTRAARIRKGEG